MTDDLHAVSMGRYVLRRIRRIIDGQARAHGLDPLEHQVLLHTAGAPHPLRVNQLATLLDVAPAFVSRLVGRLEAEGLLQRRRSPDDRRSSEVTATDAGRARLEAVDRDVHLHVSHFHKQLHADERVAALGMVAHYLGASLDEDTLTALAAVVRAPGTV